MWKEAFIFAIGLIAGLVVSRFLPPITRNEYEIDTNIKNKKSVLRDNTPVVKMGIKKNWRMLKKNGIFAKIIKRKGKRNVRESRY